MALPARTELNAPLWEVLREGPTAAHARWFDIDREAGDARLLLPVLAAPLGEELAAGALTVTDGVLCYRDHRLPLREGTAHLPLPTLVHAQHYRLAWRRLARTELTHRACSPTPGASGCGWRTPRSSTPPTPPCCDSWPRAFWTACGWTAPTP